MDGYQRQLQQIADEMTASAYHSALMSAPKIVQRSGVYKPEHQDIVEMSVRSMLSNGAGMLYVSSVVGGDVPPVHKLCDEGVDRGLLLGRKAVAKAFYVPVEHIHYISRGMMGNINDMVCMYSTEQDFVVINEEKGVVLKDNVNGLLNSSYGMHRAQIKFDWKEFKGIQFRYTTRLISSGHMAPIFMQVPGLSDNEIPPDELPTGVEIIGRAW